MLLLYIVIANKCKSKQLTQSFDEMGVVDFQSLHVPPPYRPPIFFFLTTMSHTRCPVFRVSTNTSSTRNSKHFALKIYKHVEKEKLFLKHPRRRLKRGHMVFGHPISSCVCVLYSVVEESNVGTDISLAIAPPKLPFCWKIIPSQIG